MSFMKKFYSLPYFLSVLVLSSCQYNEQTGESEPKWVFWVFLGLIAFGLLFGAFAGFKKKKNNSSEEDYIPPQVEKEIEEMQHRIDKETEKKDEDQ